ncbi:DUF2809 domain-containing protein [Clostridium formicaceticum]|nr:DUF2809 domain-containing protein [Clostridium formicaceticum]
MNSFLNRFIHSSRKESLTTAMKRNRCIYLILIVLVIILGLGSRSGFGPKWIHLYVGDVLWALMLFFIVGLVFKEKNTYWVAVTAVSIAFLVEFSQLYQATWINAIRHTKIGGLVLGFGFLWTDLLSYTIGISIGVLLEKKVFTYSHIS